VPVTVDPPRSPLALVAVLYALSGLTSLAYEVLWVRMLSQQFGVSIFGVVITVAAFMAGLGAGSWIGERWRGRVAPLLAFGLLEAAVALYALGLPWLMHYLQHALAGLAVILPLNAWYGLQGATALVVLFMPACALGIGFPLILRAAAGMRMPVGRLYGLNTLGACAGALLPLGLLPAVGWTVSVLGVAGVGIMVGLTAIVMSGRYGGPASVPSDRDGPSIAHRDLLAYAGIGAAALMLEVGWTRLYGMLLLRTEYVLAVILAVYLAGVALGSLGVRRYHSRHWWTILPLGAAAWVVIGLWALPWLAEWADSVQFQSLTAALAGQGLMIAVFTLPVTLAFGAWLPLLSGRYNDAHSRTVAARLYGANALGAALGAIVAGFVLIPGIGTSGTIIVAAMLTVVCGVMWGDKIRLPVGGGALLLAAIPVWHLPPVSSLLPVTQAGSRDVFFHEDAVSITHVIEEKDGQRVLLADLQRMDASTAPSAVVSQHNQARLPLLLHPAPNKVLFLGMGTGISAAGSLPFPGLSRTAVELSQGAIIAAGTWFKEVNDDVAAKLHIVHDDARHYLLRSREQYDVIIGDLFHPDLVGRSTLLSVEQFARTADRLAPGGIFVQWLALNQFDLESLSTVLRSFRRIYPNMCLFVDGFRLAMVGSRDGVGGAPALLANLQRLNPLERGEATGNEGPWTWLGRYWGSMALPPGPMQDDWAPHIEFRLPAARYRGELDVAGLLDWLVKHRPEVQTAELALHVAAGDREHFERAYAATELAMRAWSAEIRGHELQFKRLLRLAYDANPRDRWVAFTLADRMMETLPAAQRRGMDTRQALRTVLGIYPDDAEALRALWHLEDSAGNTAQAAEYRSRLAALSPLDYEIRETAAAR
jgi:spermidine synthase